MGHLQNIENLTVATILVPHPKKSGAETFTNCGRKTDIKNKVGHEVTLFFTTVFH